MKKLLNNSHKKFYSTQLIKISKEMRRYCPVFIVGEARSGTSILYRTLQKHSVFRPKKINLHEAKMFHYSNRSYLLEDAENSNPLCYMLNNIEMYKQFLTSIKKIRLMHRVLCMISGYQSINFRLANRIQLWWYLNLNHVVLRSFFYFAKEARGANRLVEKTPNNLRHSTKLILAFPKSKLLYIYRHPIDVYTSYVRRGKIESKEGWLNLSPDRFCGIYRNRIRIALKYSRKAKDSFLLVKYEDFTQKTDIEVKKICTFLGVCFQKETITEKNPDLTKWKPDPYLFAEIRPKTKNWRDYIRFEDAQYIETQLIAEMKMLDYERYTNHK